MKTYQLLGVSLVFATTCSFAQSADPEELVMEHCSACHGDEMYTRPESKLKTKIHLEKQLHQCVRATGINWDNHTVSDVTEYLNKHYYKFKE